MLKDYLSSPMHRYGCVVTILGCLGILFGIFDSSSWFSTLFLSYCIGVVISLLVFFRNLAEEEDETAPPPLITSQDNKASTNIADKKPTLYDAPIHEQLINDFRQLETQTKPYLGRESQRLMQEIDEIMLFMSTKIQQSNNNIFKFEISDIQRTMTAYLTPSLKHYCNLPSFLRDRKLQELDRSPQELLEQQLSMILEEFKKISESIYQNDLNQVIDHGQFLKIKLEQNSFFRIDADN